MLVIFILGMFCFVGMHTYASTGNTYTGVLISYLQNEKSTISILFETTYDNVYAVFAKTGLNIIKSIEYQGLVCLGAIKDGSLLSQLQKDTIIFKVSFNRDFVELEKRVAGLEEKKRIQEENDITMFDPGTTYETEKAKLKDEIDAKAQLHRTLITSFSTTYTTKTAELISNFQSYLAANQQLLAGIKTKITKVQGVVDTFSEVETIVTKINSKVAGLDELITKMDTTKTNGLVSLDKILQTLVTNNINKYKKLDNLSNELSQQKMFVLGQYEMDLDEYLTNNLQTRYNRASFVALKNDIAKYKTKYHSSINQLNCSNILSTSDESTALLNRINAMKIVVGSGLAKIESEGISTTFKDQLFNGFKTLYVAKYKQRYYEYIDYIKGHLKIALKNTITSIVSTTNTSETIPSTNVSEKISTTTFTKPFTSNQYHTDIKALQNILTTLGLYTGAIDGIYNTDTKEGVYQFQRSKGLLKGYENKPDVRGYFGPATRKAINNLNK
ncbi:MAG: peptidoglycan-binding protein [Candidatus Absconditabacterales bacterium]